MKPTVLAVAGKIGSGKTTLSKQVSEILDWRYASFGDYIRNIARNRNLNDKDRRVLQEIGESLIANGWTSFCEDVLRHFDWVQGTGIVIDGVRHVECVETLHKIVHPLEVKMIFIDIEDRLRFSHLSNRSLHDLKLLNEIEKHSTEVQVDTAIKLKSDKILDGNASNNELVSQVIEWLKVL